VDGAEQITRRRRRSNLFQLVAVQEKHNASLDQKSAGTFNEDELDEACWKGYHKEGNKKMFGKTYPNCVKNTNEEEQLDEKCWDSHKQVGMKKKGDKMVQLRTTEKNQLLCGDLRGNTMTPDLAKLMEYIDSLQTEEV
jgi:hypothetical protein